MSVPDFERAEYVEPTILEGEVVGRPSRSRAAAFPLALVYGMGAAIVGAIFYGMVASLGFMISIVAIGIAWLIARAMMTASGGVGDRRYQLAAVLLTYFAVTVGEIVPELYRLSRQYGPQVFANLNYPAILRLVLLGPLLELGSGLNGILGIAILGIGLRTAWRMAAGSPGFGGSGARPAVGPWGPRW
jgi:hypothetical protein